MRLPLVTASFSLGHLGDFRSRIRLTARSFRWSVSSRHLTERLPAHGSFAVGKGKRHSEETWVTERTIIGQRRFLVSAVHRAENFRSWPT